MLAEDFIAARRTAWERLETLHKRARSGLHKLSAEELHELGRLYRQITSDLAVARRDYARHPVNDYLNGLVARTHGQVYQRKSARLRHILVFFAHTFPRVFRETWHYTLAAFLMFLLPALVSFVVAYYEPEAIAQVFPGFQDILTDIKHENEWWKHINEEGRSASSSLIMTNNIRVAFIAFAGGILMGIFTLYVLAQNGILFGGVAGASQRLDFADNLWGFVAAHGMVELSVIFIAGGAGLQVGWSLVRPGLLTRRSALVVATRRAVVLIFGSVPLLVLAGIIEGFISPSDLPLVFKLAVSLGSGVLLYSYLLLAGTPRLWGDVPVPD